MVIYIQNTLEWMFNVIVVQLIFDGFFSFLSGMIPERILDRKHIFVTEMMQSNNMTSKQGMQDLTMAGKVCAVIDQLINY